MATSVTLKPNAIDISGSTSGTTTLQASAVAGTTTLTLPAATDTLVGKATTDTLTNKTLTGAAMNGTLGATTPSTASVTTLTTSSTVTHSGGTANGVAYLDGSKVLTTGSALTFDGTNLGVGTSSPAQKFVVSNAGAQGVEVIPWDAGSGFAYVQGYNRSTSAAISFAILGSDLRFWAGGSEQMRLTSTGLGVGNTSPAAKLHIGVASAAVDGTKGVRITNPAGTIVMLECGSGGDSFVGTTSGSDFNIRTNNITRATFDNSGNLLVGKTSTSATTVGCNLQPSGYSGYAMSASTNSNTTFDLYSTGASAYRFYVGLGGTVFATSTTISAISDIRFKENVRDLDVGLDKIMALKPRLYDWKEGKGADIKNARGFIAQEFEEVFPDLIDEWRDPAPEGEEPYKSVRQDLIPVLVKAIQEQQAIIQSLTARITALESA